MACLGKCTTSLTNVTISGNRAEGDGGGLVISGNAAPTLTNTIVWGNTASFGNEISAHDGSGATLSFSLFANANGDVVGPGTVTTNNSFSADPLFVNAENGDLRLMNSSPAINAGDPDTDLDLFPDGNGNPVDRDDNPRVAGERIDIGAYENQGN
jgi:parallel beta-helix repeat protein